MSKMELDVHTHSLASGHYSDDTVTLMLQQAKKRGLKVLGISEHGPAMPGSCKLSYFMNIVTAPPIRMDIRTLYGAEVNIVDHDGTLDLPDKLLQNLDYGLAALHQPCCQPGSVRENTAAYIAAMKHPRIKIIAHPDDVIFPVDFEQLFSAAMDQKVLLEINNTSLTPGGPRSDYCSGSRFDTEKNSRAILELSAKYRYPVLLSSDSHGCTHVGDFTYAIDLIQRIEFPEELIINSSAERFLAFLQISG